MMRHAILWAGLALGLSAVPAAAQCRAPANAQALVNEMAGQLNATRTASGLPALRYNRQLSEAAITHACDMVRHGFFAHRGTDGTNSHQRVLRAGFNSCLTAENLSWGYDQSSQIVGGWLQSAGHRRNMLNGDAREFGIGVIDSPRGPYTVLVVSKRC